MIRINMELHVKVSGIDFKEIVGVGASEAKRSEAVLAPFV